MHTGPDFFENMPSFPNFKDVNDNVHYQAAPSGSWIVVSDVKGSTSAIEAGRYKDVNTVGAATIVAIQNALPNVDFPFVFGGDGATALIPGDVKTEVERELSALRHIALSRFHLELRVGMVSIDEIHAEGFAVDVAKYALNSQLSLAMFKGGGLTRAEEKVKGESGAYDVPQGESKDTDLTNLSCRWRPLKSQNGQVLSLLVAAVGEAEQRSYAVFLEGLNKVFDGKLEHGNPVNIGAMRYRPLGKMLNHDLKHQTSRFLLALRMVQTLIASLLFGLRVFRWFSSIRHYVAATPTHSDHLKFDDKLRMTLDCTPEQIVDIEKLCRQLHDQGKICYGMHVSGGALMTCYVDSFKDGDHIHFIDGGDGGYAMAAKELKAQLIKRDAA